MRIFLCCFFYLAKFRIKFLFDSFFKALRVLYQLLFSVKERVLTDYSVSPRKLETCHPNYLKIDYFVSRSLLRLPNTWKHIFFHLVPSKSFFEFLKSCSSVSRLHKVFQALLGMRGTLSWNLWLPCLA